MGLEIVVAVEEVRVAALLERLTDVPAMLAMVDGQLWMPGAPPPAVWRELRLRTPAGTVTLARRPGGVAVVVFGNADDELVAVQRRVAEALAG